MKKQLLLIFLCLAYTLLPGKLYADNTGLGGLTYKPLPALPYSTTLTFNDENVQEYESTKVIAFTFDVNAPGWLHFTSSKGENIFFNVYSQDGEIINGYSELTEPVKAGTYYLMVSDETGMADKDFTCRINLNFIPLNMDKVTDITLNSPYSGEVVFNETNSHQIADSKIVVYRLQSNDTNKLITCASDKNIDFEVYNGDMLFLTNGREMNFVMMDESCYLFVHYWGSLSDYSCNINITTRSGICTDVGTQLPFSSTCVMDEEHTFLRWGRRHMIFKFTVQEEGFYSLSSTGGASITLSNSNMRQVAYGSGIVVPLRPGKHHLALEASYQQGNPDPVSDISISQNTTEAINLPFNETFHFDNAPIINGTKSFLFKFNIPERRTTTISVNGAYTSMQLFNAKGEKLYFYSPQPLEAGDYYMWVYATRDNATEVNVAVSAPEINYIPINLPHDELYVFDEASTFLIDNRRTFARKFNVEKFEIISFASTETGVYFELYDNYGYRMYSGNKIDNLPFESGEYRLLIDNREYNGEGDLSTHITITKIPDNYPFIELPFNETLVFNEENTQNIDGYMCLLFKTELSEKSAVFFFSEKYASICQIFTSDGRHIEGDTHFEKILPAGVYYICIDARYYYSEEPDEDPAIEVNLAAAPVRMYDEIDYSNLLILDIPSTGTFTQRNQYVVNYTINGTGRGYVFNAEKGKSYEVTFTASYDQTDEEFNMGLSLLKGSDLTGEFMDDVLIYNYESSNYNTKNMTVVYTAENAGPIRVLPQIGFTGGSGNILYSLHVRDINVQILSLPELLATTERTITYSSQLAFTTQGVLGEEPSTLIKGDNNFFGPEYRLYAEAYKISMEAGQSINVWYSHSAPYMAICDAGGVLVETFYTNDIAFTAPETQDYFILCSTHTTYGKGAYLLTVWNTGEKPDNGNSNEITFNELLTNHVKEVIYSSDLKYVDNGTWSNEGIRVKSDSQFHSGSLGSSFSASAYAVELSQNDIINIRYTSSVIRMYISIYDASGQLITESDRNNPWQYTAPNAGQYFVVISPFYSYNNTGIYGVQLYANETPVIPAVTSFVADAAAVQVTTHATNSEVLHALNKLTLTAIVDNGDEITVPNSLFRWVISEDGNSATYTVTASDFTGYSYTIESDLTATVAIERSITPPLPVITALTSATAKIKVWANATNEQIKQALAALSINALATDNATLTFPNSVDGWDIASDGESATFTPVSGVMGYTLGNDLSLVVAIERTETSSSSDANNNIKIFVTGNLVHINGVEIGTQLLIADLSGRILTNRTINTVNEQIYIPQKGMYIIRINNYVTKIVITK